MSKIVNFFEEQFGDVRVKEENGIVWFVASDVAKALGYDRMRNMTRLLNENEKGEIVEPTAGGQQKFSAINESGVYHSIFMSRKKEAEAFRNWVTETVLPSIRRFGFYVEGQETMSSEEVEKLKRKLSYLREKADEFREERDYLRNQVEYYKRLDHVTDEMTYLENSGFFDDMMG